MFYKIGFLIVFLLSACDVKAAPGIEIKGYEPCQPIPFVEMLMTKTGMEFYKIIQVKNGALAIFANRQKNTYTVFIQPDEALNYGCYVSEGDNFNEKFGEGEPA